MKLVIVGYGVVGKNMHKLFPLAEVHDPPQGIVAPDVEYDIAFVCVPTNPLPDGSLDTDMVEQAVFRGVQADVYCVKSTIPIGTTEALVDPQHRVCFSPEYYGETVNANGYDYPFVILGGNRYAVDLVAELYKRTFTGEIRILKTDSTTAELVKFMENAFLATKVAFVNEFASLAREIGVDPDEARELWLLDPRIGRSHTFSFPDQPYYDSKCLNKDVPGVIADARDFGVDMPVMKAVVRENEERKAQR